MLSTPATAAGKRRPAQGSPRRGPRRAAWTAPSGGLRAFAGRLALCVLCAFLAGCAHAPQTAPAVPATPPARATAPAKPRPKSGYEGRVDSLGSVDAGRLKGKRIVLDPGHGGFFTGCVGVGGLTEAEVNLAVALKLRDLLVAQGAEVTLTRDRDRDYLTPADSTLKSDLQRRVEIANDAHADLFVSIHHNADPGGLHDVNETQVYYQLGDEGPSYDLANDVMRSLARNVGIETVRLLPGNFYVVRGSEAPALLTESSYLTDPDVEAKLRTDAGRQIEAEALYLGVARYFMRRVPVVDDVRISGQDDGLTLADGESERQVPGNVVIFAEVHGAFDQADVRIDGVPAGVRAEASGFVASNMAPLAIGAHEATIAVRLAAEGSSRLMRVPFEVVKPARSTFAASVPTRAGAPAAGAIALRITAVDVDGLPRPESLAIHVHIDQPRTAAPRDTTVTLRDGIAWAYVHAAAPRRLPLALAWTLTPPLAYGRAVKGHQEWAAGPRSRAGFAQRMPEGARLADAPGTAGLTPAIDWLTRDGFVSARGGGDYHAPQLPGFRSWGADSVFPPRYTAIAGGALWGKHIVLDPEGGGDDAAGTGRTGTRAATLNLDVARALAAMLRAAGAEVRLTREGDAAISEVERVQIAEGFKADRYLRIGHAAAPPVIGHYFSSGGGTRWGQRLAQVAVALGLDSVRVADVAKYALTQASSVALYASLARIDSAASEARLLAPGALRTEAYALYVALAREFAPEARWAADSLDVRDEDGTSLPNASVRLGGALVLTSDALGRVRYFATEPGPLEVRFPVSGAGFGANSGEKHRSVLIDSGHAHDSDVGR